MGLLTPVIAKINTDDKFIQFIIVHSRGRPGRIRINDEFLFGAFEKILDRLIIFGIIGSDKYLTPSGKKK